MRLSNDLLEQMAAAASPRRRLQFSVRFLFCLMTASAALSLVAPTVWARYLRPWLNPSAPGIQTPARPSYLPPRGGDPCPGCGMG